MEFKDYYKILGVNADDDTATIKKAYRRLARKYHPDVSKEADAEVRFKEVGEAYEVLKDDEKRAAYDQLRQGGFRQGDPFSRPSGWDTSGFGGGQGGFRSAEDLGGFSDFFESLFGGGFRAAGGAQSAGSPFGAGATQNRKGQNVTAKLQIDLATAYTGGSRQVSLDLGASGNKTLNVKIPAGSTDGKKIRLKGQGQPSQLGGPPGDLLLELEVQPHASFAVEGQDVSSNVDIWPWQAALGDKVDVETLGGTLKVTVPKGARSGQKLRLRGRGLPGKTPGDHTVTLLIQTPQADSPTQQAFYEEMAKTFV